jgi:putative ABC transport system permease protein
VIQLLPQNYEAKIENIDGVDNATHSTWFGGIYQEPRNFFAQMPIVPEELFDMYPEFVISDEHKAAWLETRSGVLVGHNLGQEGWWPDLGI